MATVRTQPVRQIIITSVRKQEHCSHYNKNHKISYIWNTYTVNHNVIIFSERELKFMFAICHRPSVCLSSVVCLSVVCNVRALYSDN